MINKAVVAVLASAFLSGACRNKMADIHALSPDKNLIEDKATSVTIIYSTNGRVEARLFAAEFVRAEQARPPYTDAKEGVRIEFLDSNLEVETRVSAHYARWYETKGNILLRDSVRVENIRKGESLITEELVWNDQKKIFFTEKPVQIHTPTQTLFGNGLEANQEFTRYRIVNFRGSMKVNKTSIPM